MISLNELKYNNGSMSQGNFTWSNNNPNIPNDSKIYFIFSSISQDQSEDKDGTNSKFSFVIYTDVVQSQDGICKAIIFLRNHYQKSCWKKSIESALEK